MRPKYQIGWNGGNISVISTVCTSQINLTMQFRTGRWLWLLGIGLLHRFWDSLVESWRVFNMSPDPQLACGRHPLVRHGAPSTTWTFGDSQWSQFGNLPSRCWSRKDLSHQCHLWRHLRLLPTHTPAVTGLLHAEPLSKRRKICSFCFPLRFLWPSFTAKKCEQRTSNVWK